MSSRFTRRAFTAMAASAPVVFVAGASAQTPVATASADLFASVDFQPGVLNTAFGQIELPENPQRIVTLNDGMLDAGLTLGIAPVGHTASSNGSTAAEYLLDKVPADSEIVGGWGEMEIEQIIMLEPDLILSDPWIEESAYAALSQIAPIVAIETQYEPNASALQPWEVEQLTVGHATGKLDEAKQAILDLRAAASDIAGTAGDHAGESVLVFRPQPEFPVVMAHQWISGTMLSWCGFVGTDLTIEMEPPHSARGISLEQLNLLEADWLLAAARTGDMAEALQGYLDNPGFQMISAVENDQVRLVAGDLWSGSTGVLAGYAMLKDIEGIIVDVE